MTTMEMTRKERIDRGLKVRTEGIYAISSYEEILYLIGPRLLLIVGVLLLPLVLELAPYWKRVVNIMCVYAILALAFDFLANYVGLVCLGGALFIGVGGYLSRPFSMSISMCRSTFPSRWRRSSGPPSARRSSCRACHSAASISRS